MPTALVSTKEDSGNERIDSRTDKLNFVTNGTTLAFTAVSPSGEIEIWLSDGTTAGTKRLADSGLLDLTLQVRTLDSEGDGAVMATDRTAPASVPRRHPLASPAFPHGLLRDSIAPELRTAHTPYRHISKT